MLVFLFASQNLPFTIALVVVLLIAFFEGVGSIFGAGLSNIIGSIFPDSDIVVDFDGPNAESPTGLGRILSWLRVGQVPVLVLLIVFLVSFGISGLILQKFLYASFGFMLPAAVASIPALIASLPLVRALGGVLNMIIPKDETSALSTESFIGRVATIVLGDAKKGSAAQGKLRDRFGQDHYIMIEPDNDGDVLASGSKVLLVRKDGSIFYAISSSNELL